MRANKIMKSWTGNSNSIYKTLGASNHSPKEREANDYYATDPIAIDILLNEETFTNKIWEPACGEGHLSNRLKEHGLNVYATDLIMRTEKQDGALDFFAENKIQIQDIITNPPYKYALEFIKHSLEVIMENCKVAMFLKIQFLEGKKRKKFFLQHPPKTVYVSSSRILCAKNGEFEKMKKAGGSAVAYGWFVWEKGYHGDTIIKWVN